MPTLAKRLLLALAVAAVLTAVVAPIPTVRMHRRFLQASPNPDARHRTLLDADGRVPMAAWLPATDATVELADAGLLLRRLFPFNAVGEQRPYVRELAPLPMLWESASMDPTLFRDARASDKPTAAFDRSRIFRSVQRRLTPEERAYAANVADDSLWFVFDRVAHAAAADLAAASFTQPLRMEVAQFEMPIPRISRVSALSDGVAMRAALYAAAGQRDSADAVIGRLYAVGILFHREGLNTIEGLLGHRTAMNAVAMRRGLHETLPLPGSSAVLAALDSVHVRDSTARRPTRAMSMATGAEKPAPVESIRANLIRAVANPAIARAYRLEALGLLSLTPCASGGRLLFGPGEDVTAAQAGALQSLPRTAAESAYVALLVHQVDSAQAENAGPRGLAGAFLTTNRALAAITFNPRLRVCTEIAAAAVF